MGAGGRAVPTPGPAVQQMSVDGAMAPLIDGSWREVRTLAIGTVLPGRAAGSVRCVERSYFSRLADAATFTDLAAGEGIGGGDRRGGGGRRGWGRGARAFSMPTVRRRCAFSTSPRRAAAEEVAEAVG